MAIAKNELQILWSSATSLSVAASSNATSDAVVASASHIAAQIQVKCDNSGAPASGDTVDLTWLPTLGDPDGASSDEHDTSGHGQYLGRIDTNVENPAIQTFRLEVPFKGGKLYAKNNSAARAITVSACVLDLTG